MTKGFIKLHRENLQELLKYPFAYSLLTQIALRAKRDGDIGFNNLAEGEAFIGDYKTIGATQRQYRTAKQRLKEWNLATFKATNKGTIAKLTDARVFDINLQTERQAERQASDKQHCMDNVTDPVTPATTNKEIKNKEIKNKEIKKTKAKKDFFGLCVNEKIDKKLLKEFLGMRKEIKKPATERALKIILKKLGKFKNPNEALKKSIVRVWTDVWDVEDKPLNGFTDNSKKNNDDDFQNLSLAEKLKRVEQTIEKQGEEPFYNSPP